MNPKEMKPGLDYIVTKRSSDGSIDKGFIVSIAFDGALVLLNQGGWYDKDEWQSSKMCDFEVDLWDGGKAIKSVREQSKFSEPLSLDELLAFLKQRIAHTVARKDIEDNLEVIAFLQACDALQELRELRNLVTNTIKSFDNSEVRYE